MDASYNAYYYRRSRNKFTIEEFVTNGQYSDEVMRFYLEELEENNFEARLLELQLVMDKVLD